MALEGKLKTGDLVRCDPVFERDWNGKFELYDASDDNHFAQYKGLVSSGIVLAIHPRQTKHHGTAEAVYVMAQNNDGGTAFGWTPGLYLEAVNEVQT